MGSRPEAKKCHFYFIQCEAWGKVLESVSRQARLQRVLRQRLRNRQTQLKSHIVVLNQVEFQHATVLRKMQWGLVQRPKRANTKKYSNFLTQYILWQTVYYLISLIKIIINNRKNLPIVGNHIFQKYLFQVMFQLIKLYNNAFKDFWIGLVAL